MKRFSIRTLLVSLAVLVATSASAAGRYDLDSGEVAFDCVSFIAGPYYRQDYAITLAPVSEELYSFVAFRTIPIAKACDAVFDVYANTLMGEVRVVDDIYAIELDYDKVAVTFQLAFAEYRRASETALWVVSNGTNKLYLGGTIHILKDADFPLHRGFAQAYDEAETVVFEYDPALPITTSDLQGFYLPANESLRDYTSPAIQLLLDEYLQQFNYTLNDYANRKPWFFNNNLYFLEAGRLGYKLGVDSYFMELAQHEGKTTGGLETVLDQVDALAAANSETDVDWNLSFIQRLGYIRSGLIPQDLQRLIDSWREGDMDYITASNQAYRFFFPLQYELVLANRNRNWIPVIESSLETPEVELILAGFSHFAGPDNVLELLAAKGYTIKKFVLTDSPFADLDAEVNIDVSLF